MCRNAAAYKMGHSDLVYEAERFVHLTSSPSRFANSEEAHEFLSYVLNTQWFNNRWPKTGRKGVSVTFSRHAAAWSNVDTNQIWLPFWACNTMTLLHELAHICSHDTEHGQSFRDAHLALVKRFMGADAARAYKHALIALGV